MNALSDNESAICSTDSGHYELLTNCLLSIPVCSPNQVREMSGNSSVLYVMTAVLYVIHWWNGNQCCSRLSNSVTLTECDD